MNPDDQWLSSILSVEQRAVTAAAVADEKVTGVIVGCAMVSGAVAMLAEQGFSAAERMRIVVESVAAMNKKLGE